MGFVYSILMLVALLSPTLTAQYTGLANGTYEFNDTLNGGSTQFTVSGGIQTLSGSHKSYGESGYTWTNLAWDAGYPGGGAYVNSESNPTKRCRILEVTVDGETTT